MKLTIDLSMDYALEPEDPTLLVIEAARTGGQSVIESALEIEDAAIRRIDGEGGMGQRVWARPHGARLLLRYRAVVDVTRPDPALGALSAAPWHALPDAVLTFMRPSRFCPSDQLVAFVRQRFGHLEGGEKVLAIRDWVASALSYVPGSSTAATTATDTFVTREGVCRDYAQLVCSLARAANIPARYTTGYGAGVTPPDFHAVAEVWLDGAWHQVDATGMSTASGLAVIGTGRDAGDVAFMETEKWATLLGQRVLVRESEPDGAS